MNLERLLIKKTALREVSDRPLANIKPDTEPVFRLQPLDGVARFSDWS